MDCVAAAASALRRCGSILRSITERPAQSGQVVGSARASHDPHRLTHDPVIQAVLQRALHVASVHGAALGFVGCEQTCPGLPGTTAASFQQRLCASCIPLVSPRPPVGGCRCAASPTMNTRPT